MTEIRRIAVVIPKYGLVGGAEGFAAELTERIAADSRFDVHVFANRWLVRSDRITFHRIPIIRFPRFCIPLSFAWQVHRAIAAAGPFDLIHTHDRIMAADVYTMHGVPHRWWVREVRKKMMSLYDRATAAMEDRLVLNGGCGRFLAVSTLARSVFLKEYPINPDRVKLVHPGIDLTPYAGYDRDRCRQEVRARFGIAPNDPLLLFVSMNFDIKGLDHILRGMGRLRAGKPGIPFCLLVVGRGNETAYRRLAREQGLEKQVVFAGEVARERLPELYLGGDGYIMLSRFDTFGMVVPEAMAAGLPVLISSQVGARDLVREGENGFVVENIEDADSVADRIAALLEDGASGPMRLHAIQTARENSWEAAVKRVVQSYEEVWKERGRPV